MFQLPHIGLGLINHNDHCTEKIDDKIQVDGTIIVYTLQSVGNIIVCTLQSDGKIIVHTL